jgi:DNA-binding winged helix-turn-helix (wHTH) protein/Tol biopolymer transport system component
MAQPIANPTNPKVVRFGIFELDLDARELRKSGVKIKLHEQPFQILAMLLERPGSLVTREELQKKLWPGDTFVDFDLSLNSAIKKLRQALNDDSENPRYVETLYRRGYRFIGPVNGSTTSTSDQMELVPSPASTAPSGPVLAQTAHPPSIARRRSVIYGAAVLLLILAGAIVYGLVPSQPPRVLGFTQITHDGLFKTQVFSDGERLYLMEMQGDHFVINQVSVAGGETSSVPTPFPNVLIHGMTPNGSSLIVSSFQGTGGSSETWSLPLPSGPPRRMSDFDANSVTWSPDGSQAMFSKGLDIFAAKSDLSEPRKVATAAGHVSGLPFSPDGEAGGYVSGLQFSPDGRKLRFNLGESANSSSSIWEMARDGSGLRPLLPGWNTVPQECCGTWTPDGRYFVFESFRDGRNSLWALAEKSSWFGGAPKPVQLTNGPLDFQFPVVSQDGKRIFAVGSQPRCELVHFDGKSGFEPYLNGGSIRDVAFSPDGKWMAYVTVPEGQLWRSRVDGSERLQLTPDGMDGGLPRWSRDGKQIVFMGTNFQTDWMAYLIDSDGTGLRELIPGAKAGYDPGWSADGKSISLGLASPGSNPPGIAIYETEYAKALGRPIPATIGPAN